MNADCLTLTTYFGERRRTEDKFVADALLELYSREDVQLSLMLRGVEGFGLKHHLRTDRLLTLSEDLPLVSVAVDTRKRIEALLEQVTSLKRHGLITLDTARMLTGEMQATTVPNQPNDAVKLTIYVGRQERVHGSPSFVAVCDLLHRRGIASATVLLGVDGTVQGVRQRGRFFGRKIEVPMMIIAIGSGAEISRLLPELGVLLQRPLLTLKHVQVCKRDGQLIAQPRSALTTDGHGLAVWQKLSVYASQQARHGRIPMHLALIRKLRTTGASGATCLRGIWGFDGGDRPHGDRVLQVRRNVPIVTVIVGSPAQIAESFQIINELTSEAGLVINETVQAIAAPSGHGREHGSVRLGRDGF